MRSLLQDIRFAFRTLRRRRAFTAVAIGTLALGIGAATAMYSVLDGVVFRPLPFDQPGRLAAVWETNPQWRNDPILSRTWDHAALSLPDFVDWRAAQTSFMNVGTWTRNRAMLGSGAARGVAKSKRRIAARGCARRPSDEGSSGCCG